MMETNILFKLALIELAKWSWYVGGMLALSLFARSCPLWLILTIWAIGAIITHVWLYRTTAGPRHRLLDFSPYAQDSGIFLIVGGWPFFAFLFAAPMAIQARMERLLGLYWEAGERKIK